MCPCSHLLPPALPPSLPNCSSPHPATRPAARPPICCGRHWHDFHGQLRRPQVWRAQVGGCSWRRGPGTPLVVQMSVSKRLGWLGSTYSQATTRQDDVCDRSRHSLLTAHQFPTPPPAAPCPASLPSSCARSSSLWRPTLRSTAAPARRPGESLGTVCAGCALPRMISAPA